MAQGYFKTSERRRELSAATRRKRKVAGKPVQPNVIDEALSAAIQSAAILNVKRSRTSNPTPPFAMSIYDGILESAIAHLVDVRGLDREQSKAALQARLIKRRQYKTLPSKKG